MTLQVTGLTHEDLVNLLSTATYGNSYLDINVPDEFAHLFVGECWEDKLANVLLNGGNIEVTDTQSEEPKEGFEVYGTNHVATRWEPFETWNSSDQGEWGNIVYTINLDNILKGCSNPKAHRYFEELFVSEDGDMWTAYNLMQIILFDEEIYG